MADIPNYPSASHKPAGNKPKPKQITPVIERPPVKHRNIIRQLIIGDDAKTVGAFLLTDVVVPTLRDLVVDAVKAGAERLVYGDSRRSRAPNRINYSPFGSIRPASMAGRGAPLGTVKQSDTGTDFLFSSLSDAATVHTALNELIDTYGQASISDLNQLMGADTSPIDNRWGWLELIPYQVKQTRSGHILQLPEAKPLR
jgi:hypothetical protein